MKRNKRQSIYDVALPFAEKNLKKISVIAGRYDGSQKCQHVSRQILEDGNAENITITLSFIPDTGVNVHFINKIGGQYVDNVLGYLSKKNTYYLISEHTLEELQESDVHMSDMLFNVKKDILGKLFSEKEMKELDIKTNDI